MRKKALKIVFIVLILFSLKLFSAETEISGKVKLFSSFFASSNNEGIFLSHDSGDFLLKRVEVNLKFSGVFNDNISYNIRFDSYSYPGSFRIESEFPEAGPLGAPLSTEYNEFMLYEANIKISDFLIENLDLTIGKQRIFWGAADKLNVVDNLNPIDFANFFTFDPDYFAEKRPQTALNFEYYAGDTSKIQFVILLQHQLSPLPYNYTELTKKGISYSSNIVVNYSWENKVSDLNYGVRFSSNFLNTDFALSYYKGNFSLPLLYEVNTLIPVTLSYTYPEIQVLGLDFSGELKGVGFWGEFAYFIPEDIKASINTLIDYSGMLVPLNQEFSLLKDSFIKFVLGVDYNFGKGFYSNLQYLHGFFDELSYSDDSKNYFLIKKGMFFGEIEDYISLQIEKSLMNDDLKVDANFLYEISDESNCLTFMPEISMRVADGFEIQTGGFLVLSGDKEKTKFSLFKDDKLIYLSLKLSF